MASTSAVSISCIGIYSVFLFTTPSHIKVIQQKSKHSRQLRNACLRYSTLAADSKIILYSHVSLHNSRRLWGICEKRPRPTPKRIIRKMDSPETLGTRTKRPNTSQVPIFHNA